MRKREPKVSLRLTKKSFDLLLAELSAKGLTGCVLLLSEAQYVKRRKRRSF